MAKKKKFSRRIAIFAIGMIVGLGLILFDQFETISGVTGLTLIEVPIDPVGGQILGTVKFGAPIDVPFERSGTILSADFIGGCLRLQEGQTPSPTALWEIPFGRIGSGDRNAEVSWHGYNGINCGFGYLEFDLTDLPNDFVATGVKFQLNLKSVQGRGTPTNNSISCTVIYLSNTIDEIGERKLPNRIYWGSNIGGTTTNHLHNSYIPSDPLSNDFVAWGGSKYTPTIFGNIGTGAPSTGEWCRTTGVKSFTFGQISPSGTFSSQKGVDIFNEIVSGGAFPQGTRSDKFTLGFFVNGVGANKFVIDHQWWEENGSLLVTGSSQPIRCGIGFNQVDFRCIPIICPVGQKVDVDTNQCIAIECPAGETLEIIEEQVDCPLGAGVGEPFCVSNPIQRAVCTPVQCNAGEELVNGLCELIICPSGTSLIGSTCDPLFCGEGFEINGNECTVKTCNIGEELISGNCQTIICPINTVLLGNDCIERSCPTGQVSIDNVCQDPEILSPVECEIDPNPLNNTLVDPTCIPADGGVDPTMLDCGTGLKQVGDSCVPIDLDCPEGTEQFENVCVQRLPSLIATGAPEFGVISIIGIVTFAGSLFGLVGSVIRRS